MGQVRSDRPRSVILDDGGYRGGLADQRAIVVIDSVEGEISEDVLDAISEQIILNPELVHVFE